MKILIVGANSILSEQLYIQHQQDEVKFAYHSAPPNFADRNFNISGLKNCESDFDIIYIVSAIISNSTEDISSICDVNLKLPQIISKKFKNSRIIYFSSISVYNNLIEGVVTETTFPSPNSLYGASKLMAEIIVKKHPNYGIIRISSMYGVGMNENTFLPKMINDALMMNKITIFGEGSRMQNYVHSKEIASIAKQVALSKENITVLGISKKNYSNLEVGKLVKSIVGCELIQIGDDSSRSIEYLNEIERNYDLYSIDLKDGLKQLIEWKRRQF